MKKLVFVFLMISICAFAQSQTAGDFEGQLTNDVVLRLEDKTTSYSSMCSGKFQMGISENEVAYTFSLYDCGGKDYFMDPSLLMAIIDGKLYLKDNSGNVNTSGPIGQVRPDGSIEFSISKTETVKVIDESDFLPNQCGAPPPREERDFVVESKTLINILKFESAYYIERTSNSESIYIKRTPSQTCPGRSYFKAKMRLRGQMIKGAAMPVR